MKKGAQKTGHVVAVCSRPVAGIPKTPQREILVGPDGIEGDHHAGPKRISRRTGRSKRNDRQISIVANEVLEELNQRFGIAIPQGGFGENILVAGLGDLSGLSEGDQVCFENGVIVEVTEQNVPCAALKRWHKQIPSESMGRRGVVGVVKKEGVIRPDERVTLKKTRLRAASVGKKR